MLDKGYIKNLNKVKSKLNLDNNKPSFLEDDESEFTSKFTKPSNLIDRQKIQTKNPKIFDLDQIKKQLGLIESRNSKSQHIISVNSNKSSIQQPQIFPSSLSFKKQKNEQSNGVSRFMVKKKQAEPLNPKCSQTNQEQKTGFTERITELVKMRQQHQRIINSLVNKKASNLSTDEDSLTGIRKRNPEVENKYIRVLEAYEINKREKQSESQILPERLIFKKQSLRSEQNEKNKQSLQKKRTVQEMYNEIQVKLNTPKKKQSPKQKVYKTQSSSANDQSVHNISQSRIEESLNGSQKSLSKRSESCQEVFEVPQSLQQSQLEMVEESQLNESKFEMQQHVNLIASLSQFQFKNSRDEISKDIPLEHQLHFSIDLFVNESMSKSKLGNKNQLMGQIKDVELKYTCMETEYQSSSFILKAVRKIKDLNGDFIKIVEFLCLNDAWEGLFTSQEIQYETDQKQSVNSNQISTLMEYRGLQFDNGSYTQVILSNKPLQNSQKKLLIFNLNNPSKTLVCDISLILLSRLIDLNTNKQFPQMLNRLFGYQFKTFKIDQLNDFMQCLDYIDRLREIHNKQLKNQGGLIVEDKLNQSLREKYSLKHIEYSQSVQMDGSSEFLHDSQKHCDFFLYGQNKTTQSYELIRPSFFSQKNKIQAPIGLYEFRELMRHQKYMKRLSQIYQKLTIINNKQLPVKSIKLKHFENHFVVVSVNVAQEGLYFMSVGGQYDRKDHIVEYKYRMCLISTSTKTILECLILSRNESYPVYLPKQEFQVYISAYQSSVSTQQIQQTKRSNNPNNAQIINFMFYMQSQHISAKSQFFQMGMMENRELEFQLRLKEEYKNYTSIVLQQFIEFSFLDKEITKFFILLDSDLQNFEKHQLNNRIQNQPVQSVQTKQRPQKEALDFEFTSTIKSFKFPNIQSGAQIQKFSSKPTKLSEINHNLSHKKNSSIFETQKHSNTAKSIYKPEQSIFTFEEMQFEQKSYQITILRVHLKALDLFIDCVNTANLKDLSDSTENDFEFKIKYSQERVLCDLNHHKNTVLVRSNTINLIYLTKDSPIEFITKQNEFCQKINTNHVITHKIFRKEW